MRVVFPHQFHCITFNTITDLKSVSKLTNLCSVSKKLAKAGLELRCCVRQCGSISTQHVLVVNITASLLNIVLI